MDIVQKMMDITNKLQDDFELDFGDDNEDFNKKYVTRKFIFPYEITCITYNNTGNLFAACDNSGLVRVFDTIDNYKMIIDFHHQEGNNSIYFSPDNEYLVVMNKLTISFYRITTFKSVFTLSTSNFTSVSFDNKYAAIGMIDKVIIINIDDFSIIDTIECNGSVNNVIFYENYYIIGTIETRIFLVDKITKNIIVNYNNIIDERFKLTVMKIVNDKLLCCYYGKEPEILNPNDLSLIMRVDMTYPVIKCILQINDKFVALSGGLWGYILLNMDTYEIVEPNVTYSEGFIDSLYEFTHRAIDPHGEYIATAGNNVVSLVWTPEYVIKYTEQKLLSLIEKHMININYNEETLSKIAEYFM
jgi:WD40 repeat protein